MVNQNIQSPIPLAGAGHFPGKPVGWVPGQYKQLVNAEIDDFGNIVNRRPVRICLNSGDTNANHIITAPYNFIGTLDRFVIVSSYVEQKAYSTPNSSLSHTYTMWDPNNYDGNIFKCFRYNNVSYWVGAEVIPNSIDILSYSGSGFWPTTYAGLTVTAGVVTGTTTFNIKEAFMHKDRLWIATDNTVYFSKATDPKVFASPDGGFFKLTESTINSMVALGDSVYIICDSSIWVLTYNIDPNQDATLRRITGDVGGDSATIYDGNIYFVKDNALYVISNTNVTRVRNLNLGISPVSGYRYKITNFDNYLVIGRFVQEETYTPTVNPVKYPYISRILDTDVNLESLGIYFLNMNNGSIHAFDFRDPGIIAGENSQIGDFIFNPVEDSRNLRYLYFLGRSGFANTSKGAVYAMPTIAYDQNYAEFDDSNDTYYNGSKPVPMTIEIDGFSPDGTEYNVKRIRSLLMTARVPYDTPLSSERFTVQFAFDNGEYGPKIRLDVPNNGTNANNVKGGPYPLRIPINQRCRTISMLFTMNPNASFRHNHLLINDLRLLWDYTKRGPINRTQSNPNGLV